MPNTKRRFADDDPSDDEDDDYTEQPVYRGGGKQLSMGKQFQARHVMQEDSDEDDDSEEDDVVPMRGAGKQFRPSGGKQLRVMHHESEDDDEDEEVIQPVARSGGKSLFRPPEQDDSDDDEDDEPVVAPRGGGKSLMGMQQRGGGKQLRPPAPQEEDDDDDDSDDDYQEEEAPMVVTRAPHGGGKQLRRPVQKSESEESDDDDLFGDDDDDEDDDDDDAMEIDDSSEEEEVIEKPAPKRRGRPPKAKAPPKKTPARAAKTKAKQVDDMDESDSSSSEEERELDMETFDTQALVENEEDQKYLDSLPELDREAILAERFEKLKAAADMKKALRESKRKEREAKKKESAKKKPAKKKKASKKPDTDGDAELAAKLSEARESKRNRDVMGTKAKKDAARAAMREQRRLSKKEEEEEEESDLEFESDEDSDEDYEEAGLKPWQKKKAEKTSKRLDKYEEPTASSDEEMADAGKERAPAVEAELEDYMKVTLPRRRLARWCNEPFFDQAVIGCFVRLFIGESEDGKKCYRLCEIIGVEELPTEYNFPVPSNKKEKPISTTKYLKLRFGKNEKVFPMYLVSDSRPTDEDVKKYASTQKSSRKDVLGKKEASKMRKKQDELVNNYTYTEADIEKNISARKKRGKGISNLGSEQTRVAVAVQAAQSAVEDARRRLDEAKRAHLEASENDSEELEQAIKDAEEALEEAKKNLVEKKEDEDRILAVVEKRKKKLSRQQDWTKINERATMTNKSADFQSYKEQQAKKDAESASGSAPRFNPYARRKVKPKILWEVGQKEEKKDDDATKTDDNETREDAAEVSKGANGKDGQQTPEAVQEDILGSQKAAFIGERHQFSIDEEALTPDATSILGPSKKKQKVSRARKGLSFAEYQERKSAGTL